MLLQWVHMTANSQSIPLVPAPVGFALRVAPVAPMSLALTAVARRLVNGHPGLLARLGDYANRSFVIDPTDLPVCLLFRPDAGLGLIRVCRTRPKADACVAGPLSALLGLVHGTWDGDALFFSRDLVIEGDTSAALALRNAIDDAELDLGAEIAGMVGPLARALKPIIKFAERRTGMPLRRAESI